MEEINNSNNFLKVQTAYIKDPLALYYDLTKDTSNTILLESLEVQTQAGTNSLLGISSALKFICNENDVTVKILNNNGKAAAKQLLDYTSSDVKITHNSDLEFTLSFPKVCDIIDEDSRLKHLNVLDALRSALKITPQSTNSQDIFLAGIFGYELIESFENLPSIQTNNNSCPNYCFYLLDTRIRIDHKAKTTYIDAVAFNEEEQKKLVKKLALLKEKLDFYKEIKRPDELSIIGKHVSVDITDREFCKQVKTLKDKILEGEIFQIALSRTFSIECPSTINAYYRLKHSTPSPYMFYLADDDFTIFGASPESSIQYNNQNQQVQINTIAGSKARVINNDGFIDLDLDTKIELELRQNEKERLQHLMYVDLARNDIARISETSTRFVKDFFNVERHSQVMYLVSRIAGKLRTDLDALYAYQSCLNSSSLTGTPKIKAIELIRQTEQKRRGSYGGAIGFLRGNGDMDTCIVMHSAFVKDSIAYVQASSTISNESSPIDVANKTRDNASSILNAIAISHGTTLMEIM